ncbi:MAG: hypothetical protein HYU39_08870 [Thaumarchaeota archaeon]|nr:hypothetical protein [Nitrososphaerota archaeon]
MVRKGEWHDYENGKKKEYGEFVKKAREFAYAQPVPAIYYNTTSKGGKPNKNDPRALVICLLLKIWLGKPYRDMVSFLSDSTCLWPIIGLKALPGRMDLQRAMNRLTKEYLSQLNSFIVEQGYYSKKGARQSISVSYPVARLVGLIDRL